MNCRELDELVVQLKKIFDVVRLVDVDKTEVVMPEQSHGLLCSLEQAGAV